MNFGRVRDHIESFPRLKIMLSSTRRKVLCLKFYIDRKLFKNEFHRFDCNICGKRAIAPLSAVKNRGIASCCHCGSSKRFRTIVAALSKVLFGKIIAIPDFDKSKHLIGLGLSDADNYAISLSRVFSYENTYYHKEPRLDITSIKSEMHNRANFIIASDVFEHVPPPIGRAFDNLFKILKSDGVCIFSVPYKNHGATEEHFPELYQYKIVEEEGTKVLINRTLEGSMQKFEKIRFHGGPGHTLEMRLFSKSSLLHSIQEAGFINVVLYDNSIPDFGVLIEKDEPSLIISMRKP